MVFKHKYRAKVVERQGRKFPSKKEAEWFDKLELLKKAGEIDFFLEQVPMRLPGGVKHLIDFLAFYADGTCEFIEVKGYDTPMGKAKRKMVEDIYPITIRVV